MKNDELKNQERKVIIDICKARMSKSLPVLRSRLGLSQGELAGYLGITRQSISTAENNHEKMTLNLMMALVLFFRENAETATLMKIMGVDSNELQQLFKI